MIDNSAIALGVANPKPKQDEFVPPVPIAYVRHLIDLAARLGWNERDFATKAGISYQTLYRDRDGQPGASEKSVRKMRRALEVAGLAVPVLPLDTPTWANPDPAANRPKLDEESETIRAHLVEARERVKLKIAEASSRTGIPASKIEAYEHGSEQPTGAHVRTLAKAYGYRTDDIVEPVPLPDPDRAVRPVIWYGTDDEGVLELLSDEERADVERFKALGTAINQAARQRALEHQKRKGRRRS